MADAATSPWVQNSSQQPPKDDEGILGFLAKVLGMGSTAKAAPGPSQGQDMGVEPAPPQQNPLQTAGSPASPLAGSTGQSAAAQNLLVPSGVPQLDLSDIGKTSENRRESGNTAQETESKTQAISDEAFGPAYARLTDGTPGLSGQRADLGAMRKATQPYLDEEAGKSAFQRTDLSPVLQFASALAGKDVAPKYQAPVNAALKPLIDAGSALAKGGAAMTAGENEFLKTNLADKATAAAGSSSGGTAGVGTTGAPKLQVYNEAFGDAQKEVKAQGGVQSLSTNLGVVNAMAQKYKGGLPGYRKVGGVWTRPGGLSWGQYANQAIGIGREEQADMVKFDSAMAGINNAKNHDTFGQKLTEYETSATGRAIGDFKNGSPQALLNGLKVMQGDAAKQLSARQNAYGQFSRQVIQANPDLVKPENLNYSLDGSVKQDPRITGYAKDHGLNYDQAKAVVTGRGYKPNER